MGSISYKYFPCPKEHDSWIVGNRLTKYHKSPALRCLFSLTDGSLRKTLIILDAPAEEILGLAGFFPKATPKLFLLSLWHDQRLELENNLQGEKKKSEINYLGPDVWNIWSLFCFVLKFFFNIYLLLRDRDKAWAGEEQSEEETQNRSRLQAPSCWHRARLGTRTHKLRDHALSQSQMLNLLNHPGAPVLFCFVF